MTYSAQVLADSPTVYLRLNETSGTAAADSSGNGNNWTYSVNASGMTTGTLVTGDGDAAAAIINPTNVVTSPVTPSYLPASGLSAYTLELIVNISSYGGAFGDQIGGSNPGNVYFTMDGSGVLQFVTDGPNCTGPALSLGTRYHLVATYDGANVVLYVNGTAVDTQPQTGLDGVHAGQFFEIGYSSGNAAQFVADEFAFYSTALSSTRVAVHFAALPAGGGGGGGGTGAGPEVHMFREQLLLVFGQHHRRDPLMLLSPLLLESRSDEIYLPFLDASAEFF